MSDFVEATALEQVAGFECPECGPMADLELTEAEALDVLGGDERGFTRCPNDWCREELEPTLEAALAMLEMVAARLPGLVATITDEVREP